MNKTAKTISLIIVIFLGSVLLFNIFNAPSASSAVVDNGETPWYVTLFIAWAPSMVFVILYVVFLRMMKQGLLLMERIASALEKK